MDHHYLFFLFSQYTCRICSSHLKTREAPTSRMSRTDTVHPGTSERPSLPPSAILYLSLARTNAEVKPRQITPGRLYC